MDPRQLLSRLAQLKAEGDQIMQQLVASGMPPEQIMAAVEGGGQPAGPPPGMGAGPGPDLPPGIPQGPPIGGGGGMPRGLLGPG
jgi:hypothetical protein